MSILIRACTVVTKIALAFVSITFYSILVENDNLKIIVIVTVVYYALRFRILL